MCFVACRVACHVIIKTMQTPMRHANVGRGRNEQFLAAKSLWSITMVTVEITDTNDDALQISLMSANTTGKIRISLHGGETMRLLGVHYVEAEKLRRAAQDLIDAIDRITQC